VQLLLHHQVHGQNLLIRVGHESRIGRRSEAEGKLIRYLVFADEAELPGPIKTGTEFGRWFEQRGQRDSTGRSLRQWNLQNRLFEYRLSYLIESELFDNLPKSVKRRIYDVLFEGLSAASPTEPFDHIPLKERQTILEIVRDIKHDLPAEWQELR